MVYILILTWQVDWSPLRWTYWSRIIMIQVNPSLEVGNYHQGLTSHSLILDDIIYSKPPVCSHRKSTFCRYNTKHDYEHGQPNWTHGPSTCIWKTHGHRVVGDIQPSEDCFQSELTNVPLLVSMLLPTQEDSAMEYTTVVWWFVIYHIARDHYTLFLEEIVTRDKLVSFLITAIYFGYYFIWCSCYHHNWHLYQVIAILWAMLEL